jgi:hypothetical protein
LIADFKRWASTNDDSHVPDFILLGGLCWLINSLLNFIRAVFKFS